MRALTAFIASPGYGRLLRRLPSRANLPRPIGNWTDVDSRQGSRGWARTTTEEPLAQTRHIVVIQASKGKPLVIETALNLQNTLVGDQMDITRSRTLPRTSP